MGKGQGTALDGSPIHRRALSEHLWVQCVAQGYLGSALGVPRLQPRTVSISAQSHHNTSVKE